MHDATEQRYLNAVISGDFWEADRVFPMLPGREATTRAGELVIEWRAAWVDRVLSCFGGEGMKGSWRVLRGRPILYGCDEWIALGPDVTADDREALSTAGIL